MDTSATKFTRRPRVVLLIAGAIVAITAIVYFSFFYPPVDTQDTQGTIGAAKKWRSEQITDNDVKLEGVQTSPSGSAMADATQATDLKSAADGIYQAAEQLYKQGRIDAKTHEGFNATTTNLQSAATNVLENKRSYDFGAFQTVLSNAQGLRDKMNGFIGDKAKEFNNTEILNATQSSLSNLGNQVLYMQQTSYDAKGGTFDDKAGSFGNRSNGSTLGNQATNPSLGNQATNPSLGNAASGKNLGSSSNATLNSKSGPLGNKGNAPSLESKSGNPTMGNKGGNQNLDNKTQDAQNKPKGE